MAEMGYDASTIRRRDGVVAHDPGAFPAIETVERDGTTVRAYAGRPASLDELFRNAVDRAPDRNAVAFPETDDRYTYRELGELVDGIAVGLCDAGVTRGDRVAMILPNTIEFVATYFACARAGAVSTPVNTRLAASEVSYLLDDAEPAAVVVGGEFVETVREADAGVDPDRTFAVGGAGGFRPFEDLFDAPPAAFDPPTETDPASLLYTSGTTGRPKGCVATHFNLVNGALNYPTSFGTGDGARSMVVVPLFHVTGLMANTLHTVAVAGTTVILDEYTPTAFLETIESEGITFVIAVPTNYILAMEKGDPDAYDLSSWEVGSYGGAPMPSTVVSRLREAFPGVALCNAYGTTETVGGLVTMCPDRYTDAHADSVGLPSPPVELKVLDDDGEPLPAGEVGELAIRGPIVVDRYLGKPEKTEEAFEAGWHLTGDLALVDDEGFVELKGRSRDMIIRGGENVYALEVEEALLTNGKVLEASVTGFPDDVLGERVMAAVVPKDGVRLTEEELRETCEEHLADYKVPEVFRMLDELPKNPNGKVIKPDLLPEPLSFGIRAG